MNSYIIYDWNGRMKWAEVFGCFLVDPLYINEFLQAKGDARKLPLNTTIY
ncbi:Hypothetical protein LUCI_2286 [Lucifera butyrica]|uniref:Uncharacterized protein n=1 Tax=Lucifera butyrica TaxID=1351585 RepID=A0A498R9U1_9FIRM|nr:hypothetical protein [Lucifera butyrica]VBB07042.1 Hypothetical protein LUCI_2286 [Lucifera butyrica]